MSGAFSKEQTQHMQQRGQGSAGEVPKTAREVLAVLKDRLREKEEYAQSIELEVHMLKDTIRATQEESDHISERIAADAKRIRELEEEAERWKLEAFQEIGKATIMTSSEILSTPECVALAKAKEDSEFALAKEKLSKRKTAKQLKSLKAEMDTLEPQLARLRAELEEKKRELEVVREERELARNGATSDHQEKEELQKALQNSRLEVEKLRANEAQVKALRTENESLLKALAEVREREAEMKKSKRSSSHSVGGERRDGSIQSVSWHSNAGDSTRHLSDVMESRDESEVLAFTRESQSDVPPEDSKDLNSFRPRSISTMAGQKSEREILLQRDRSNLLERINALQEELELARTEKELVMKDKARLVEIVARLDEELSDVKHEQDDTRTSSSFERIDESIHGQFNLPLTESNRGSFLCANDKLLLGSLYVTEHFICWAPNALVRSKFNIFRSKEDKTATVVLELATITSLHLRKLQRWSRNGRAIEISTADGKKISYRGFRNREDAVKAILDQAAAINHRVILREETA